MLLTITTTHRPATDLGFLLHKNPTRVHRAELGFGLAHMLYPEANEERCTFALVLDVDPVALVRGKDRADGLLEQYVNDRPYAASSFLSVAMARTLRSALGGHAKERPELAGTAIPLSATVTPLPVRGSEGIIECLFAPLGYQLDVQPIALDETWPEWGASPYVTLTLGATTRLSALLAHLYVLIPVLDRQKHYFVEKGEIDKLLARGEGWLAAHPARELIIARYLRQQRSLMAEAAARLAATDEAVPDAAAGIAAPAAQAAAEAEGEAVPERTRDAAEEAIERPIRLHDLRLDTVTAVLRDAGVCRVVDLGCGSGKLLQRLLKEKQLTEIVGVDISIQSLEIAGRRLMLDRMSPRQRERIRLIQGALTYRDRRLEGYDAAALVEVIEHLDPDRLPALERAVFEFARPRLVVVTTPNGEYNVRFPAMAPGQMRHADHRFEWTRAEFEAWARGVAERQLYSVVISPIGDVDPEVGAPSQMAVFSQ